VSTAGRHRVDAKYIIIPAMVMLFVILVTAVSLGYGFNIVQLFSQVLAPGGETALKAEYEVRSPGGAWIGQTPPVALAAVEIAPKPEQSVDNIALRILLIHNPRPGAQKLTASGSIVVLVNEVPVREIPFSVSYSLPSQDNQYSLGLITFTKPWLLQNLGQGANTVKIVVKNVMVSVEYPGGRVESYSASEKTVLTFVFIRVADQILFTRGVVQPWRI
jgi:hypothetical protein